MSVSRFLKIIFFIFFLFSLTSQSTPIFPEETNLDDNNIVINNQYLATDGIEQKNNHQSLPPNYFIGNLVFKKDQKFQFKNKTFSIGNLSAITYNKKSNSFYGILDRIQNTESPQIVEFTIDWDYKGSPLRFQVINAIYLKDKNLNPLKIDAEGLALLENGDFLIAIEKNLDKEAQGQSSEDQTGILQLTSDGILKNKLSLSKNFNFFTEVVYPNWPQPTAPLLPLYPQKPVVRAPDYLPYPQSPTLILPKIPDTISVIKNKSSYTRFEKLKESLCLLLNIKCTITDKYPFEKARDQIYERLSQIYSNDLERWKKRIKQINDHNLDLKNQYEQTISMKTKQWRTQYEKVESARSRLQNQYDENLQKWNSEIVRTDFGQRDDNMGIESLSLAGLDHIILAPEFPLRQDDVFIRITQYDLGTQQELYYFYKTEDPEASVAEILAESSHSWMVLEKKYDSKQDKVLAKLWRVDSSSYDMIQDKPVLKKTLLIDLNQLEPYLNLKDPNGESVARPQLDNLEGVSFGPVLPNGDRTLFLVSDANLQLPFNQVTQMIVLNYEELMVNQPWRNSTHE